jgi:hypothetical protein
MRRGFRFPSLGCGRSRYYARDPHHFIDRPREIAAHPDACTFVCLLQGLTRVSSFSVNLPAPPPTLTRILWMAPEMRVLSRDRQRAMTEQEYAKIKGPER